MDEFITQMWTCDEQLLIPPNSQTTVKDEFDTKPILNVTSSSTLENNIKILTDTYGPFCPAKYIEIDLDTACTLLHRTY